LLADITVIDLDRSSKHSICIEDKWDAVCFYEVNDESATVYTARINLIDGDRV
jgi:hypothetical protein